MNEQELQWAVDELQIRNILSQLALLSDMGDIEEWGMLFAEDADYTTASGAAWHGREAITESGRQRRGKGTHGPGSNNRHLGATVYVRSTGPDTAETQSYLAMYQDLVPDPSDLPEGYPEGEVKRAPTFLVMGYYHDRFRRTSEGWKVSHRELAQSSHSPRFRAEQNKRK
jgi:SnoaL-like domain